MYRYSRPYRCFPGVDSHSRVGIFPLHLDPPTIQHREIFRILSSGSVNKKRRPCSVDNAGSAVVTSSQEASHDPSTASRLHHASSSSASATASSSATEGTSALRFGRLKQNCLNDSVSCDTLLHRSACLEHFDEFERILSESSLAPFDSLILVPNTRFPVTLRQSVHLAAMSVLSTRDLPNVHVELKALEHPDEMMPIISQLVAKYPKSTIIHWLPNVYEMQNWKNFESLAKSVPFLLLRPRGWRSASEAAQDAAAAADAALTSPQSSDEVQTPSTNAPSSSLRAPPLVSSSTSSPLASMSGVTFSMLPYSHPSLHAALQRTLTQPSSFSLHRIADAKSQRGMMPRQWDTSTTPVEMEILEVPRMSGSFVRQELWEGSSDPHQLMPPAVLRYVESHGLYRDFRKGGVAHRSMTGNVAIHSSRAPQKAMGGPMQAGHALVAFDGFIPRLELHYDPNNLLAREQYNNLKAYECLDGRDPDLIVPIGGDGYFMHCVRRHWRRYIPFFGVNAGHVGYLLNDGSTLEELFSAPLKLHLLSMLYCEAEKENASGEKEILEELAFNDAWVERASGQTALVRILVNGEERIRRVRGDGVLMSTAAGSTAYAQALGASPVPVVAPLIQLVGSNIVSPPQWKPVHLNQEDCVELECVDYMKRPCRGFVDSVDVGIVSRMLVRTSRVAGVQVAFADSCDLQQKLLKLQFPKSL